MKPTMVASASGSRLPLTVHIVDTAPASYPGSPVAIVTLNADGSIEGDAKKFLAATKNLVPVEGGHAQAEKLAIWAVANAIGRDRRS